MKKRLPFLIIPILIIAGSMIWFLVFKEKKDANTLMVSGNVEVTDAQLGFRIAGRLETCLVNEGDTIARGALLARLENKDQIIAVDLAEAGLSRAAAVLAELTAGSRPEELRLSEARVAQARQMLLELTRGSRSQEIQSAESGLETALAMEKSSLAQLAQAKEDFDRFSALYERKTISQRDFEIYRTRYEVALQAKEETAARVNVARQTLSLQKEGPRNEQIEKAKAVLAQAEAENALVKAGPRKEKIDQAAAQVAEARQHLNQARQMLAYTELFAPMDGVVLSRSAEPGEFLNPAIPVITVGDLARPWLRAFVSETDLGRIKLKDAVTVTTDTFPDKSYQGILTYISSQAEFTPKSVQTFEERVKLMFRIKIELANPDGELKPGMPADAKIVIPAN